MFEIGSYKILYPCEIKTYNYVNCNFVLLLIESIVNLLLLVVVYIVVDNDYR